MAPFEVHESLRMTIRAIVLVAVIAPGAGLSQFDLDSVANDGERRIFERIREEELRNGPNSPGLTDPLTALALSYQERGARLLASAALQRALEIERINYGLYSLDQAPLIRLLIENERAMGNLASAWDLEQRLLSLARRHPYDLRTVPILREIADERMGILERYAAGEFPPEIILGCYYNPRRLQQRDCHSGSSGVAKGAIQSEARRTYSDAVRVLLRLELYASNELRELEMELIRIGYSNGRHGLGASSLRRLLSYDVANETPWLTRIEGLVQMADWDLLFAESRRSSEAALELYELAYGQSNQKGMATESIKELFAPPVPVVLPSFEPSPLLGDEPEVYTGHVDVSFELSRYGKSRNIRVLDRSSDASRAAENRLVRLIKHSRFRPIVTDGRFADTSPVAVRYYLDE